MTRQPEYKTLPGGSIDYAYYIDRSARLRSRDITAAFSGFGHAVAGIFFRRKTKAPTPAPVKPAGPRRVGRIITAKPHLPSSDHTAQSQRI